MKEDNNMKEYMKPSIEMLEVESEQLLDGSITISSDDAEVGEGGFYKESRLDYFFDED